MAYRIGIDIGGTFTDFTLVDDAQQTLAIFKQLTTPADPSEAVIEGVSAILAANGVDIGDVAAINHGTTLVTNAVIERRGAATGMLVTEGMKDILDIARETRYDLFDLRLVFPQPLVPRRWRREIGERVRYDGVVLQEPDLDQARDAVRDLVETCAITSLAVCFLHAYANRDHEDRVAAMIRDEFPDLYVSASAEVFPFMREYDRWTTTTMNAYVQPLVDQYIARLESRLADLGFGGRLYIMTSSGGTVTPETARLYPVRLLESGPAAGALMSASHGRRLKLHNLLSFDMGGTTAKGALVRDGQPLKKYDMEVAREHEFKAGSGLTAKIPTIDMIEIGSGGGSIAEIDERGLIRVGPRSAGAAPGPACYGQGGERPTLTDANLILGYLDPAFFLGGRMDLDRAAAERVITEGIGGPLGLDLTRAAWGIHEIINEDVARAFRVHASERGFDYRTTTMVAFGGSGPMHAARIARKLHVPKVLFPFAAGVISSLGLLISPLSFDIVKSYRVTLEDLSEDDFEAAFRGIGDEVSALLERAGVARDSIVLSRKVDMRYEGQGYEIEVQVPEPGGLAELPAAFEAAYKALFTSITLEDRKEIVNWKLEASEPPRAADVSYRFRDLDPAGSAVKGHRQIYSDEAGGFVDCPVYDRYALTAGTVLSGPALIEERESTCVITGEDTFEVDANYNIVVSVA